MPKTSSRAVTSPAGTADTMEVLCNVNLDLEQMKKVVKKTNACIVWGGALNLAPADDKIIRIEKQLSIDAHGLLLSSVMSKKLSVSTTHLLIDIPYGAGAKVTTKKKARLLQSRFQKMSKLFGLKTKVILTDGSQPVGNGVGPVLECLDVLKVLQNNDPPIDLKEKSIKMAGLMLELSGKVKKGEGYGLAKEILESGLAFRKFLEIVEAQGKNIIKPPGKYKYRVRAGKSGRITAICNEGIARTARIAGAPKSKAAGIYLHKKRGDKARKGELIATIYAESKEKRDFAKNYFLESNPIRIK
jgi:thymidine phosphorylase